MVRGAWVLVLSLSACAPAGPPDTEEARAAVLVCAMDASPATLLRQVPDLRFQEALRSAEKAAMVPALRAAVADYGRRDLGEHAAALRAAAADVGVRACPLADKLEAIASASPTPADAAAAVRVLEAVQAVTPEMVDELLGVACSEIPSCGRACVPGLAAFSVAGPGKEPAQVLADGCAEFRPKAAGGAAAAAAFGRARVSAFLDACKPVLQGSDAARVAELRAQLKL